MGNSYSNLARTARPTHHMAQAATTLRDTTRRERIRFALLSYSVQELTEREEWDLTNRLANNA